MIAVLTFQQQNNSQRHKRGWCFTIQVSSTATCVQRSSVSDWQHINRSQPVIRSCCYTQRYIDRKGKTRALPLLWSLLVRSLIQMNSLTSDCLCLVFLLLSGQTLSKHSDLARQICSYEHLPQMAEGAIKAAPWLHVYQFVNIYRFAKEKIPLTDLSFQPLVLVASSLALSLKSIWALSCF